ICVAVSSPDSPTAKIAGACGWGPVSTALAPASAVASHWALYAQGCRAAGRVPNGADWRVGKYGHVSGTDAAARARGFRAESAYLYALGSLYEGLKRAGRLAGLKSQPDQPDSDVTVESIIEARVNFGSPQTVAEQLLAFRQEAGPFGHVLVTGMDWSGPNAAWERESMQRLAEEGRPIGRRGGAGPRAGG